MRKEGRKKELNECSKEGMWKKGKEEEGREGRKMFPCLLDLVPAMKARGMNKGRVERMREKRVKEEKEKG